MNSYNNYYSQAAYVPAQYTYAYPSDYRLWSTKGGNPSNQMTTPPPVPSGSSISPQGTISPSPAMEESYIENILRLNLGKIATIYMTFETKQQQVFVGRLEAAGRDHIIISDPQTGKRYLLLMVYLDYITFDEELNYAYPFAGATGPTGQTQPGQ